MWCPECNLESGGAVCPNCGGDLRELPSSNWAKSLPWELLKKWPVGNDNELVRPAFLTHCLCNNLEDELMVGMLESFGIPSLRNYPENGSFGRVVLGMAGFGADLYVPVTMLEDALNVIGGTADGEE